MTRARKLFLVLGLSGGIVLSGCAAIGGAASAGSSDTHEGTVKAFMAACTTYKNVFAGINLTDKVRPFSSAVVAKVNAIDQEVELICPPKGKLPGTALDGVFIILSRIDGLTAAVKQ